MKLIALALIALTVPPLFAAECPNVDRLVDRVLTLSSPDGVDTVVLTRAGSDTCTLRVVSSAGQTLLVGQEIGDKRLRIFRGELSDLLRRQYPASVGYRDFDLVPFRPTLPNGVFSVGASYRVNGAVFTVEVKGTMRVDGRAQAVRQTLTLQSVSATRVTFGTADDRPARTTLGEQDAGARRLNDSIFAVGRGGDADLGQHATAFVIDGRGLFATNHHVAAELGCVDVDSCRVRLFQTRMTTVAPAEWNVTARVVADDAARDFAILKIEPTAGLTLTALPIGFDADLGPNVLSVGYPSDWVRKNGWPQVVFSRGVITAVDQSNFVTSAFSFGGASGGPVFDARTGILVGYNSQIFGTGLNTAPANFYPLAGVRDLIARAINAH